MNPLWPNLAGQQEQYLVKAMEDYREGNRKDPTMAPLAKMLSDKEIEDLAAYYAGL
jgi:cytochrome c553